MKEEQKVLSALNKIKEYSPGSSTKTDTAVKMLQATTQLRDKIESMSGEDTWEQGEKIMEENYEPLADKVLVSIQNVSDEINKNSTSVINENQKSSTYGAFIVIIIGILIMLFGAFSAKIISSSIQKSLAEISQAAQKMAKGDLNVQVDINSKDEIGQLSAAFTESANSIKAYIADITEHLAEVERGNLDVSSNMEYIGDYKALSNAYQGILTSLKNGGADK